MFEFTESQLAWLEALESGKYPQGKGVLRSGAEEFCCLGVACDIFKVKLGLKVEFVEWQNEKLKVYAYNGETRALPLEVVDELRLFGPGARLHDYDDDADDALWLMNDHGKTFKEIAAFIRANPEKVFKSKQVD